MVKLLKYTEEELSSLSHFDTCGICGDNTGLKYYYIKDNGDKGSICEDCAQKHYLNRSDELRGKDPIPTYGIAYMVKLYKTKNRFNMAELAFADGIIRRINIDTYGYNFFKKHINGYTLFYDERVKSSMELMSPEFIDGALVYIYNEKDSITTKARIIGARNNFEPFDFANQKDRDYYLNYIFDVCRDIYFVDGRKKMEYDEWTV